MMVIKEVITSDVNGHGLGVVSQTIAHFDSVIARIVQGGLLHSQRELSFTFGDLDRLAALQRLFVAQPTSKTIRKRRQLQLGASLPGGVGLGLGHCGDFVAELLLFEDLSGDEIIGGNPWFI